MLKNILQVLNLLINLYVCMQGDEICFLFILFFSFFFSFNTNRQQVIILFFFIILSYAYSMSFSMFFPHSNICPFSHWKKFFFSFLLILFCLFDLFARNEIFLKNLLNEIRSEIKIWDRNEIEANLLFLKLKQFRDKNLHKSIEVRR